jgi:hypothetical protein
MITRPDVSTERVGFVRTASCPRSSVTPAGQIHEHRISRTWLDIGYRIVFLHRSRLCMISEFAHASFNNVTILRVATQRDTGEPQRSRSYAYAVLRNVLKRLDI